MPHPEVLVITDLAVAMNLVRATMNDDQESFTRLMPKDEEHAQRVLFALTGIATHLCWELGDKTNVSSEDALTKAFLRAVEDFAEFLAEQMSEQGESEQVAEDASGEEDGPDEDAEGHLE